MERGDKVEVEAIKPMEGEEGADGRPSREDRVVVVFLEVRVALMVYIMVAVEEVVGFSVVEVEDIMVVDWPRQAEGAPVIIIHRFVSFSNHHLPVADRGF